MTFFASLTLALKAVDNIHIKNKFAFDPLLNWLGVDSYNGNLKQCSTTCTPQLHNSRYPLLMKRRKRDGQVYASTVFLVQQI